METLKRFYVRYNNALAVDALHPAWECDSAGIALSDGRVIVDWKFPLQDFKSEAELLWTWSRWGDITVSWMVEPGED